MAKRVLEVVLLGDESSLQKSLGRASGQTEKFGKGTETVHARIRKSFAGMTLSAAKMGGAVAAAYLSISGAKNAISTTEELAHTTLKLHNNLGLSIKTASEWGAVAKSRNIDGKALSQSFAILSKQVYAAANGSKSATQTFKDLGVSQEALKSGDFNRIIGETADGFKKLAPGTEKTALATKALGRGWQTVFPLLRNGSDAMNEQLALADKYGATFSGKTAKSLEEFIQKQRESKLAMEGLQVAFGTEVAPALTKVIGLFTDFSKQLQTGTGAGGALSDVLGKIKDAVQIASTALGGFSVTFEDFIKGNSAVMQVVREVWNGIEKQVTGTLKILEGIIKVFSGILTGDFGRAWDGVKDIFSGALRAIHGTLQSFTAPFRAAGAALMGAVVDGIKAVAGELDAAGHWVVHQVTDGIRAVVEAPLNAGRFLTDKIRDGIKSAGEFLDDAAGWIKDTLVRGLHALVASPVALGSWFVGRFIDGIEAVGDAIKDAAKWLVDKVVDSVKNFLGISSPSKVFAEIGGHMISGLIKGMSAGDVLGFVKDHLGGAAKLAKDLALSPVKKIANAIGGLFGGGGGSGGGDSTVRGWLATALKATGHFSEANLNALYGRTIQESGGNPRAINLTDSNALAGHPSKGLLQTIDSTFSTYKLPGHGDIWNPIDNAIAAIRYMYAVYGHIVGASATGYASGGTTPSDGWAIVGERGPELAYLPGGTRIFSNAQSQGMMGGGRNVNFNNYGPVKIGGSVDVQRELSRAAFKLG